MTNKRKHLKQVQNQAQEGRSMVEMLGVLAVIGVLSIGGIAGYRLAMNYYQANQIAYEINMMRTDAKVKIAQGTEKLTLGSPYDGGNIHFNNYGTTFACALADDSVIEENVSCQVANAFYIEMNNVSQEICRPLSKLIQGMNELIGFEITTETIEADNEECQEGDNNIHAVFSAEAVSELKACKEEGDCSELESTPVCDLSRHVCVECLTSADCKNPDKPKCEENTNTCVECQQNSFWDGEKCQEGCLQNSDCNKNGNNRSYCHFSASSVCSEQKGFKGTCKSNSPDGTKIINEGEDNEKIFIVKNETMTYWSAQNFCKSHEKDLANISDLDCTNTIPKGTLGYCYQAGGKISSRITELKGEFGGNPYWLFDLYDTSCYAYCIHLDNGHVGYVHRTDGNHYAFCK